MDRIADEPYYRTHRIKIIENLKRFAHSPEFSSLFFNITENYSFRYITLNLSVTPKLWWTYEIRINVFKSGFEVSYVTYKQPYTGIPVKQTIHIVLSDKAGNLLGKKEREVEWLPKTTSRIAFNQVDELFNHLQLQTTMMAQLTEELTQGEP